MKKLRPNDDIEIDVRDWLAPIGQDKNEALLNELAYWQDQNLIEPKINKYVCKDGHETITIDRIPHPHVELMPCPLCKQEARSFCYYVDQSLAASHEFYKPRDIAAHPANHRNALKNGAAAFRPILQAEPIRFSKSITSRLKKSPK